MPKQEAQGPTQDKSPAQTVNEKRPESPLKEARPGAGIQVPAAGMQSPMNEGPGAAMRAQRMVGLQRKVGNNRLSRMTGDVVQRQEIGTPPASAPAPVNPEIADLPGNLYVDMFESVYYDLDYRHVGGNLSKYLSVNYADGTVIDIQIDDIGNTSMTAEEGRDAMANGYAGDGGRIFPRVMNPRTTPRLAEAKRNAIEVMEEYNFRFILGTLPAVFFIITMGVSVRAGRPQSFRRAVLRRTAGAVPPANTLDQTLQAALRPNTMRHIFGKAMHRLDGLVRQLGGEEAVMREAVRGLGNIRTLPSAGPFQVIVDIAGTNVTIRGAVVNGIARISTMFVP